MKRTFNYTGRRHLTNSNYRIRINRDGDRIDSFDASFSLDDLSLPPTTKLYVEAYHLSDYARFDFGTVGHPGPTESTDLTQLGYQENIRFRILAVDESRKIGRILASANGINPEKQGGEAKEETLLPVDWKDIGHQVWLLRYGDDGEPIMVINDKLRSIVKTDIRFFVYIYPAALREVLNHLIYVTKPGNPDDLEGWQQDWLTFARGLTTMPVPELLDPNEVEHFDDNAVTEWIDQVVTGFCNGRRNEWKKFSAIVEEE